MLSIVSSKIELGKPSECFFYLKLNDSDHTAWQVNSRMS